MKPALSSCDGVPVETIHRCVLAAFADYLMPLKLSLAQLRFMLAQRGFNPALSLLARQGGEAVSFCLVGTDGDAHPGQAYVIMAGTLPAYRQRGISSEIFRSVSRMLVASGISTLRLEVVEGNRAAQGLYRKIGFRRQRGLACFTLSVPPVRAGGPAGFEIRRFDPAPVAKELAAIPDWPPSWPTDFASVRRAADRGVAVGAFDRGRCVGYGILFEPTGAIAQLAVKRDRRRRGLGSAILRALRVSLPADDPLWILNLDSRDQPSRGFFEAHGAVADVVQAEMALALALPPLGPA